MNSKIPTLSENTPLVRDYTIISTQFLEKYPDKSIIKYVVAQKEWDTWKDVVKTQFIDNPSGQNYTWRTIRFTTEIF